MFSKGSIVFAVACLYLTGCASGAYKARLEQREKLANSSGLYCEFVNGEQHPDVDVELNMQMAKRCDAAKPFSITNYKTSSEMNGVMYCCQMPGAAAPRRVSPPKAVNPPPPVQKAPPAIAKPDPAKDVPPPAPQIPGPGPESEDPVIGE